MVCKVNKYLFFILIGVVVEHWKEGNNVLFKSIQSLTCSQKKLN